MANENQLPRLVPEEISEGIISLQIIEQDGEETRATSLAVMTQTSKESMLNDAAEIVRRYNDFPALQEQNKELLEALKLLHKGANLCDMAFTPANISAGMLITKNSK